MLNIGIIEDNIDLRETIEQYLEITGGYTIIFSAGSVEEVLKKRYEALDFILLDEHLNGSSGTESIKAIKEHFKSAQIIVITGDNDANLIIKALENGASGFLNKPFTLSQIGEVFKGVMINGSYLQPVSTTRLINLLNKKKNNNEILFNKLTKKEKEIAELIKVGRSYKEIAHELGITFFTVNHHIKNIYAKYEVNSAAQLIYKLNNKV